MSKEEYQKLDWISFAIQEAMNSNPNELEQALELVEELRDLHEEKAYQSQQNYRLGLPYRQLGSICIPIGNDANDT